MAVDCHTPVLTGIEPVLIDFNENYEDALHLLSPPSPKVAKPIHLMQVE